MKLFKPIFIATALLICCTANAISVNANEPVPSRSKGAHNLGQGSIPAKRYRKASQPQPKACWSAYLEANPSMSVWADTNPEAAEKVKSKKYADC